MKKGMLKSVLLLLSVLIVQSAFASDSVLSSQYDNQTSCNSDVTKYNLEFPDYTRSSCFLNNGKYFYSICAKGATCDTANVNTVNSTQNSSNQQALSYQSGSTNSYTANLNTSVKSKIDQKIITVLKNAKSTYSKSEYKIILTNFLTKLSALETKYNSNIGIKNLVGYIRYEVEKILFDLEEEIKGDNVDDFLCELMGNCNTQNTTAPSTIAITSTTSNSTGSTSIGTTNSNTIISITVNQGALYCGDPTKNDYSTFSPVNKIVKLNNDIITSCKIKGGKIWSKSINGTNENLKNISDVKDGDVFSSVNTVSSSISNSSATGSTTTSQLITNSTGSTTSSDVNGISIEFAGVPYGNGGYQKTLRLNDDLTFYYTFDSNKYLECTAHIYSPTLGSMTLGGSNIIWKNGEKDGSITRKLDKKWTRLDFSCLKKTGGTDSKNVDIPMIDTNTLDKSITLTADKTTVNVGENVIVSYNIGALYYSCNIQSLNLDNVWVTGNTITNDKYWLENKISKITFINVKKVKLVCSPFLTGTTETKELDINIVASTSSSNTSTGSSSSTTSSSTNTYTQEQVNAVIKAVIADSGDISIQANKINAIKVIVSGILVSESKGEIGLRNQVATFFGMSITDLNTIINTYK